MSATVNIRRDVKDAFYRYKMPKIQSKIEGKGNGIKTVVSNMVEVAKALNRPPTYVTKFFGNELGSIVHCDDKTGRYIVNGAHDAEKLASLLDAFIGKFVLCPACDNPETDLTVEGRDAVVFRTCKACGHRSTVDMGHKLITFIQKNPPKNKPIKGTAEADGNEAENEGEDSNDQGDEAEGGMVAPEGIDNFQAAESKLADDWADDGKRDSLEVFGEWLNASRKDEEIYEYVMDNFIARPKAVAVAVQVLLDAEEGSQVAVNFAARVQLFKKMVIGDEKAEKAFLGGLERLLAVHRPNLLKHLPAILQSVYNSDIVSEECLIEWYEKPSKRYISEKEVAVKVRQVAKPFIDWLQQEEEDEEEEEDDE